MRKTAAALTIFIFGLVVGAIFLVSQRSLCEPLGEGAVRVAVYRIWSGLTRADRLCIPWEGRAFPRLTGPIAFEESWTSVAGPEIRRFYLAPNGTGYVGKSVENVLPKPNDDRTSFQFRNPRAYATIAELLSPLREYSYVEPRGDGGTKQPVPCKRLSGYSSFRVYWTGDFNNAHDVSFFAQPTDGCRSLKDAMRRINRARRILELKASPEARGQLLRNLKDMKAATVDR